MEHRELLTKIARCLSGLTFEDTAKVGCFAKAYEARYIVSAQLGFSKILRRYRASNIVGNLCERSAFRLKMSAQGSRGHAERLGCLFR